MKKTITFLLAIIMTVGIISVIPIKASAANTLTLDKTSFNINSGNTKTFKITLNGKSVSLDKFNWTTDKSSVAAVSGGKVTAKKRGTAVITAQYKSNTKITAKCTVKVNADYTISPDTKTFHGKFTNYTAYNKYTKQYYMIRSYLEQINYAGGGSLTFKAGTYNVPYVLYIPSNTTLKLKDKAILKKTTTVCDKTMAADAIPKAAQSLMQLVPPDKTNYKFKAYNGAHDIKIIGEGNAYIDMSSSDTSKQAFSIVMGHNRNIVVENIRFKNLTYGHFFEMDASKNVRIKNCKFYNSDKIFANIVKKIDKIGGGCINLDTPDKKTGGFTHPWTSYDCTANYGVTIENCYFKNLQSGIETHQYSENKFHTNVTIKNCTFSNFSRYPIQMMNWKSPTLINNKFTTIGTGIAKSTVNSYAVICSGVTAPTIKGNTFTSCEYIMRFTGVTSRCGYKPVDNNLTKEQYTAIANGNTSVNNTYEARELIVSEGFLADGTPNYHHVYPDIRFKQK